MRRLLAFALCPLLTGCAEWFFSGEPRRDLSHPVVLVETIGGVEFGASTEYGVLTLGRTATTGPCRVRYLLGPTPMVDDGELTTGGGVFTCARIDLRTQNARVLGRPLAEADELVAMWTPDGATIREVAVHLARAEGVAGDVLLHPGAELPTGAAVLRKNERDLGHDFVGLIAGKAIVDGGPAAGTYFVFTGVDRLRELLAVPEPFPVDVEARHRPDGITVMQPIAPPAEPKPPEPQPDGGR
jgi:hypothetical protein